MVWPLLQELQGTTQLKNACCVARRTQCVREDICSFVTRANLLVFSSTAAKQPPFLLPLKPWWPLSPHPARLYYSPAAHEIAGDKESREISYWLRSWIVLTFPHLDWRFIVQKHPRFPWIYRFLEKGGEKEHRLGAILFTWPIIFSDFFPTRSHTQSVFRLIVSQDAESSKKSAVL